MVGLDSVDRIRQPEYTGANRCGPCTVVNLVILAVVSAGFWVVLGPAVGVVVFALGGVVVYARGYLVPGTPVLTQRYLPVSVLRLFGKEPIVSRGGELSATGTADGSTLVAAGVLTDDGPPPSLTEAFRTAWLAETGDVLGTGVDAAAVREAFAVDGASRTSAISFVLDGRASVRWESTAALAADVAAASLLEEVVDGWDAPVDRRRNVLLGLRLCLKTCPSCDGSLDITTDRVDPCCQRPHLVVDAVCESCGTVVADAAVVDHGDGETVRGRLLTRDAP